MAETLRVAPGVSESACTGFTEALHPLGAHPD